MADWLPLVPEGDPFDVPPGSTVRFGADTRWVEMEVSGAGTCDVGFFGSDPAEFTLKTCQILEVVEATGTPMNINDNKYEALGDQGYVGSIDDRFKQLIQFTTSSRSTSERDYWRTFVPTNNGSLNDIKMQALTNAGFITGSLQDREAAYWKASNV